MAKRGHPESVNNLAHQIVASGSDDGFSGFDAALHATVVIGVVAGLLGLWSVLALMRWARRSGRTRRWLMFPLTLAAVICCEASLTVTGVAVHNGSVPDGRALIFGVVSAVAVLCMIKQRPTSSPHA